ncbi:MAG: glycosyl-4,4'-diaponeurosporenoate acyltransferase [Fibrobacteria bacterium]|nr:glycosyl-4,4'-diaponeurosporenoate acyltransferase [Fibrobacteria bacterium]
MQIWYFSHFWTVIIDTLAWFLVHMGFAWFVTSLPANIFNPEGVLFKLRSWEKGGKIYQKLFRVHNWKKKLPDGAALFKKGFKKKKINSRKPEYLERFVLETCRGEAAHWLVILAAPLFFLWNPPWAGLVMIGYAFCANLPCIIVQRYNRPWINRLIKHKSRV